MWEAQGSRWTEAGSERRSQERLTGVPANRRQRRQVTVGRDWPRLPCSVPLSVPQAILTASPENWAVGTRQWADLHAY